MKLKEVKEVKAEVAESTIVKRSVDYDEETKTVYMTTEDGVEVEISCPKTRQLMSVRKLIKKYEPDAADDEETIARLFSVACVSKYGDKENMSYDEYLDLSMADGLLLAKSLSFFPESFQQLQSII